jgi:hypothetical protein
MKYTTPTILTSFAVLLAFGSGPMFSQDVLPFPASPMGGKVGPTMQESVHKWREAPRYLPADAPNCNGQVKPDTFLGSLSIKYTLKF